MTALVIRADTRRLPLPDASVDLIVTSPPYFALRSYTDGGEHYAAQIGSEPTPGEYIAALLECTREWMRVLKPSGSLWVNLGDKYAGGGQGGNVGGNLNGGEHLNRTTKAARHVPAGYRAKSLLGLPWRYAIGCIDELGLILRAEVIWSKPNALPESVTDRVRRSHEHWFHFTREPRYYSAVDEIRQPHVPRTRGRNPHGARGGHYKVGADGLMTNGLGSHPTGADGHLGFNPLGALPGSVWEVATQPLTVPNRLAVDHFAAFPMEWPRRIILGWSPPGICTACGEGRRPVVEASRTIDGQPVELGGWKRGGVQGETSGIGNYRFGTDRRITGEACACPEPSAPTRPSVVVDPFGGTGTTALVASVLGRTGISFDASHDYCRLAQWRTADPGERARALGVPKPQPVSPLQGDLFAEEVPA